jgi:hypothetical protein
VSEGGREGVGEWESGRVGERERRREGGREGGRERARERERGREGLRMVVEMMEVGDREHEAGVGDVERQASYTSSLRPHTPVA